eukprot:152763-Pelagomonas_calceolata.AAC.5
MAAVLALAGVKVKLERGVCQQAMVVYVAQQQSPAIATVIIDTVDACNSSLCTPQALQRVLLKEGDQAHVLVACLMYLRHATRTRARNWACHSRVLVECLECTRCENELCSKARGGFTRDGPQGQTCKKRLPQAGCATPSSESDHPRVHLRGARVKCFTSVQQEGFPGYSV